MGSSQAITIVTSTTYAESTTFVPYPFEAGNGYDNLTGSVWIDGTQNRYECVQFTFGKINATKGQEIRAQIKSTAAVEMYVMQDSKHDSWLGTNSCTNLSSYSLFGTTFSSSYTFDWMVPFAGTFDIVFLNKNPNAVNVIFRPQISTVVAVPVYVVSTETFSAALGQAAQPIDSSNLILIVLGAGVAGGVVVAIALVSRKKTSEKGTELRLDADRPWGGGTETKLGTIQEKKTELFKDEEEEEEEEEDS